MDHLVVVLSFFGRADTMRCVRSLVAGNADATVLVVDNGSFDGVLDAVADSFPSVHCLQLPVNLGFSGGMNAGLRYALQHGAKVITVLNNDTIVGEGLTQRLAQGAARGYLVSPVVHYLAPPGDVWFGAGTLDETSGFARHQRAEEWADADADGYRLSGVLAGCCLTTSAEIWSSLDFFDNRYFLNFEDSDLSLRARAAGVPLRVDTKVRIEHAVSSSFSGAYSLLGLYFYCRNGLLFIREHSARRRLRQYRFLRHHLAPALVTAARTNAKEGLRVGLIVAWAVADNGCRRYGPAPVTLFRLCQRWAPSRHGIAISTNPTE